MKRAKLAAKSNVQRLDPCKVLTIEYNSVLRAAAQDIELDFGLAFANQQHRRCEYAMEQAFIALMGNYLPAIHQSLGNLLACLYVQVYICDCDKVAFLPGGGNKFRASFRNSLHRERYESDLRVMLRAGMASAGQCLEVKKLEQVAESLGFCVGIVAQLIKQYRSTTTDCLNLSLQALGHELIELKV